MPGYRTLDDSAPFNREAFENQKRIMKERIAQMKLRAKLADENGYDHLVERFEDDLKEATQKFVSDLEYNVSYDFDLREPNQVHIGKSSAGWLFNFQHQDIEIDGVKVKWHSYEDVMSFLKEWVSQKKEFVIIDEYNRVISYTKFKDLVDTKQKDTHNLDNPDNFHYCDNVKGYRFSSGDFS